MKLSTNKVFIENIKLYMPTNLLISDIHFIIYKKRKEILINKWLLGMIVIEIQLYFR